MEYHCWRMQKAFVDKSSAGLKTSPLSRSVEEFGLVSESTYAATANKVKAIISKY